MNMNKFDIPSFYSTKEASRLSGLPQTTLDYLARSELLTPSLSYERPKRGRPRRYSFGDIVILRAIAQMTELGVSVSRLKVALKQLFAAHNEITPGKIPGRYLVTDGMHVYFRKDEHSIESLNEGGQLVFSFVLEVESYRDEIVQAIRTSGFRNAG